MIRYMFVSIVFASCLACSNNYYGYTEQQWNKLGKLEQEKIKQDYQTIISENQSLSLEDSRDKATKDFIERAHDYELGGTRLKKHSF